LDVHLGSEEADIRLRWTAANYWTREKRECENLIWLTSNPQPFSERR